MDVRREVGASGESAVAAWYEAEGYSVVARNWRVRAGEIDVIARRGSVVVFCEVKTRRSGDFGFGAEAVTHRKQVKVRAVAREWLAVNRGADTVRFDVADVRPGANGWVIDVIEGAF